MISKWFDATEAKKFGAEIATLINHRTPNKVISKNQERLVKKYDKRHEVTLGLIEKRLENFKKNNHLNIYKKAQLGNTFKYSLLESGYDQDFCNKTTTWLLLKCK